jgi:hypothetical protein
LDLLRALTDRERETLDHLLSVEMPGVDELRAQAKWALAVPWDCGCASIDLMVDRRVLPQSSIRTRPAIEADSREKLDPTRTFTLLLWVDDGWLSGIEVVDYLERHEDSPAEIPPPSEFDAPRPRTP